MNIGILYAALEELPQPLLFLDVNGAVICGNRAFERLTGVSCASLCGEPLGARVRLELGALQLENGWASDGRWIADTEVPISLEVRTLATAEERVYALLFSSGEGERDRRRGRLESLGRLTGGIAHDLNNLLTGVLGHIAYLQWVLPQEGEHVDSLRAVADGSRRGAALATQILEFVKGEEIKRAALNLTSLVSSVLSLFRAALPKTIRLSVRSGSEDLPVYGEEGQLSQLIMNLVVNARDALPNGGTIEVSFGREVVEDWRISFAPHELAMAPGFADLPPGRYVRFSVSDDGIGIPEKLRSQIFEPFFTTKAENGTGLGLANVSAIVHAHDGTIALASSEGRGSRFDVFLPEHAADTAAVASTRQEVPTGGERILVVEDEDTVRTVLQRCLEHLGYTVDTAADGSEGLQRYSAGIHRLVILDMMMPGMSGDQVFAKLQEIDPTVRVLISSGYSTDARAQAVLHAGVTGFISKPFAIEELAREVRRCLDG